MKDGFFKARSCFFGVMTWILTHKFEIYDPAGLEVGQKIKI